MEDARHQTDSPKPGLYTVFLKPFYRYPKFDTQIDATEYTSSPPCWYSYQDTTELRGRLLSEDEVTMLVLAHSMI